MELKDLTKRAKDIRVKYDISTRNEGGKVWGVTEYTQGLVGDVGDLMKLVMAKQGLRFAETNIDKKLARELADCLWALCIIADKLDIDIEKEFLKTMDQLDNKISEHKIIKQQKRKIL